jgi:aspartate/methionine/tyrosine aminotransferase
LEPFKLSSRIQCVHEGITVAERCPLVTGIACSSPRLLDARCGAVTDSIVARRRTERFRDIQPFDIDAVAAAAGNDPDVLRLENLDTDVAPPAAAVAATRQMVGSLEGNSWLPFTGLSVLRQAVADRLGSQTGRVYADTDIVITGGALAAVLCALLATVDHGDEVVLTDPTYAGFINRVRLAGARPVTVPLHEVDRHWRLDVAALRAAITRKTRALLLMSPSMPSGHVFSDDEWAVVAEVCDSADAWLLYDAAMDEIVFDGRRTRHPATVAGLEDRTITLGGVSKNYRMIGWRVGWAAGPASVMGGIALAAIYNTTVASGYGQIGAVAALTQENGVGAAVAEWQARRDLILGELAGLPVVVPDGGWSLLLDAEGLGVPAPELSRRLLEHGRIAATPMTAWGTEVAPRYVRFVYAREPEHRLSGLRQRVDVALERA